VTANAFFGLFRAHRTCLVAAGKDSNVHTDLLAGFEVPLYSAKEREGIREGRKGTKRWENTPAPNKYLVTALHRCM